MIAKHLFIHHFAQYLSAHASFMTVEGKNTIVQSSILKEISHVSFALHCIAFALKDAILSIIHTLQSLLF